MKNHDDHKQAPRSSRGYRYRRSTLPESQNRYSSSSSTSPPSNSDSSSSSRTSSSNKSETPNATISKQQNSQGQTKRVRKQRKRSPRNRWSRSERPINRPGSLDKRMRFCLRAAGTFRHLMGHKKRPPISDTTFHNLSDAAYAIEMMVLKFLSSKMRRNCLEKMTFTVAEKMLDLNGSHQVIVELAMNRFRITAEQEMLKAEMKKLKKIKKTPKALFMSNEGSGGGAKQKYILPDDLKLPFKDPADYFAERPFVQPIRHVFLPNLKSTTKSLESKESLESNVSKTSLKSESNDETPKPSGNDDDDDDGEDDDFPPMLRDLAFKSVTSLNDFKPKSLKKKKGDPLTIFTKPRPVDSMPLHDSVTSSSYSQSGLCPSQTSTKSLSSNQSQTYDQFKSADSQKSIKSTQSLIQEVSLRSREAEKSQPSQEAVASSAEKKQSKIKHKSSLFSKRDKSEIWQMAQEIVEKKQNNNKNGFVFGKPTLETYNFNIRNPKIKKSLSELLSDDSKSFKYKTKSKYNSKFSKYYSKSSK